MAEWNISVKAKDHNSQSIDEGDDVDGQMLAKTLTINPGLYDDDDDDDSDGVSEVCILFTLLSAVFFTCAQVPIAIYYIPLVILPFFIVFN